MTFSFRRCPKCTYKMTLLFTSYVCDVCDPPKSQKIVLSSNAAIRLAFKEIPWNSLYGIKGIPEYINSSDDDCDVKLADVVIAIDEDESNSYFKSCTYVIKHPRFLAFAGSTSKMPYPVFVTDICFDNLKVLASNAGREGIRDSQGTLIATHYIAIVET